MVGGSNRGMNVSHDLSYAREDLEQLGNELRSLSEALRGDGRLSDVSIEDVAHHEVVGALEDFAGDWDDKRKALADSLGAISDMATETSTTLGDADAELARQIRDVVEGAQ